MDLGVAIGASVEKKLFSSGLARSVGIQMSAMALEAEEWHGCIEQVIVDGSVWSVAVGAVFGDVAMLVCEWPLLLHMASGACFLLGIPLEKLLLGGAMGLMAVDAGHLLFPQRVMGKEITLRPHLGMATKA